MGSNPNTPGWYVGYNPSDPNHLLSSWDIQDVESNRRGWQKCRKTVGVIHYVWRIKLPIGSIVAYIPTFSWFLWEMQVNIPYMDRMGWGVGYV